MLTLSLAKEQDDKKNRADLILEDGRQTWASSRSGTRLSTLEKGVADNGRECSLGRSAPGIGKLQEDENSDLSQINLGRTRIGRFGRLGQFASGCLEFENADLGQNNPLGYLGRRFGFGREKRTFLSVVFDVFDVVVFDVSDVVLDVNDVFDVSAV